MEKPTKKSNWMTLPEMQAMLRDVLAELEVLRERIAKLEQGRK